MEKCTCCGKQLKQIIVEDHNEEKEGICVDCENNNRRLAGLRAIGCVGDNY